MYTVTYDEERLSDDDLDEIDSEDEDRQERFIGESSEMFKSESLNDLKPFYNGTSLKTRKDEIRKAGYYIRHNWGDFDIFLSKLKAFLLDESNGLKIKNDKTAQLAERLLTTKRDWRTSETINGVEVTFDAIKIYTSVEGYKAIFGLINQISRKEDFVAYVDHIRCVVFLVELISIDLHNYCLLHPEKTNFRGLVYRGMTLTEAECEAFRLLSMSPIDKREISVPCGIYSSSTSIDVAKRFIKLQMELQKSDTTPKMPMLIKIHVIGLKQDYKDIFTAMFPTSVLTTICAVDIHELSRHRGEQEVLLKIPFFLVLDMYADENIFYGKQCDVLEMVMLNDDRDPMSTVQLGELDGKARDIFECMATITKSEFAVKYCSEKELLRDAEEYSKVLAVNTAKLDQIMNPK